MAVSSIEFQALPDPQARFSAEEKGTKVKVGEIFFIPPQRL
jgi:hypothetical protein